MIAKKRVLRGIGKKGQEAVSEGTVNVEAKAEKGERGEYGESGEKGKRGEKGEKGSVEKITIINDGEKRKNKGFLFGILFVIILILVTWLIFFKTDSGLIIMSKLEAITEPVFGTLGIFFKNMGTLLLNPGKEFGSWENPNPLVIEDKKDVGVKINSFEATKSLYSKELEQDILLTAEISVENIEEDAGVEFSCDASFRKDVKEYDVVKGKIRLQGGEFIDPYKYELKEGRDEVIHIVCKIPKDDINKLGIKEDYFSGIVTLKAVYPAKTRSLVRLYTFDGPLSNDGLEDFRSRVNKEGLLFRGRIRSYTASGPMRGYIDIKTSQPVTEKGNYFMSIGLENTKGWLGEFYKMDDMTIRLPKGTSINKDYCIDFDEFGKSMSDVERKINCQLGRTDSSCNGADKEYIDKDNLVFSCEINVDELSNGNEPEYDLIQVDYEYDYAIIKKTTIDFMAKKETAK